MATCAFVTFGCKINFYDTQGIREVVLELGYREIDDAQCADLVVVNACTVTARAGERGVAAVRRLLRRNPGAEVIVTGCMTLGDRAAYEQIPGVRWLVGNEEKDQIPALLTGGELQPTRGRRSRNIFNLRTSHFTGRTRAFLKVHDGCDSFCSYCILPFLRGKSKSRPVADVVGEAERLAGSGHRELVLTGIHLSRYGRDLDTDTTLVALLRALRAIPGVDRVRLSSIGEGAFSDELVGLFRDDPGFCRFFHIPLQSGSDAVLARMRRDYTVAEYRATIERIRAQLPDAWITTDLIVGFPGETEEEFEQSLAVCREVGYGKIHLFPYSPREGTKAAKLPDPVPLARRAARMRRARELEAELARTERRRWVGRDVRVLVESHRDGRALGLCRAGLRVSFPVVGEDTLHNHEVTVHVTGEEPGLLTGEACGLGALEDTLGAAS